MKKPSAYQTFASDYGKMRMSQIPGSSSCLGNPYMITPTFVKEARLDDFVPQKIKSLISLEEYINERLNLKT